MSGWLPIFDTLHGIRGEINLIIKVPYVDIFVLILILKGRFFVVVDFCYYIIQLCFICGPLDSTVWEDDGIEHRNLFVSILVIIIKR
jgi:hypothetical protein